jgi:pectin methylesterase-like acyl-CoA thioesterase
MQPGPSFRLKAGTVRRHRNAAASRIALRSVSLSMPPRFRLGLVTVFAMAATKTPARDFVVAADGSGDFRTVQAAVDAAPARSSARTVITLRRGLYRELVTVPEEKTNLTLRGEDRAGVIIAGENNARLNPRRRELFSALGDGLRLETLTLHNTTPKGGTQAEALRVNADRVVLDRCDFRSFQDTLRLDGRVYVRECRVEGDVDFIWGAGTVWFERCHLHALHNGYLVQSRNGADRDGYVFVDCRIDTAPHVERFVLARIDPGRFPHSHVAFIRCTLGPGVSPAGWIFDGPGEHAPKERIRFWEHGSLGADGRPLEVARRIAGSRQLTSAEANAHADLARFFGGPDSWNPLSP